MITIREIMSHLYEMTEQSPALANGVGSHLVVSGEDGALQYATSVEIAWVVVDGEKLVESAKGKKGAFAVPVVR